jgi:uncharacterized protein YggE
VVLQFTIAPEGEVRGGVRTSLMKPSLALCFVIATASVAHAEKSESPPRQILVTGDAEIKVVPDQVILSVAVETLDKDLLVAKQQNDDRVKRVLAVMQQFKVDPKHIQTDQITIEPRTRSYNQKEEFLGFAVHKSVVICLKDMSRFEAVLMALLKAGTNRVDGVQFQTTELRKQRDQARLQAIRAAHEKAVALAGELGQKLGRPRSIIENSAPNISRGAYQTSNAALAAAGDSGATDSGFAPGQISVNASVTVTFDLAD